MTLELEHRLIIESGFASSFYQLGDGPGEVLTESGSARTRLTLRADEVLRLTAFLYGNPALNGAVRARSVIALRVKDAGPVPARV